MHVSKYRHVHFIVHFFQNAQTFHESRPAKAAHGSSISFVVRSLKDERDIQRAGHTFDDFGHEKGVLLAFDNARPCDEKQITGADADALDLE